MRVCVCVCVCVCARFLVSGSFGELCSGGVGVGCVMCGLLVCCGARPAAGQKICSVASIGGESLAMMETCL